MGGTTMRRGLSGVATAALAALAWASWPQEPQSEPIAAAAVPELDGQESASFTVLDDGSRLNLDITAPDDGDPVIGGNVALEATFGIDAGSNRAVVFGLDLSISTLDPAGGCTGDFNGDGRSDTILDCQSEAVLNTIEGLAPLGVGEVGVNIWEFVSRTTDTQPDPLVQAFTAPDADLDGDGVRDLETVLRSFRSEEVLDGGIRAEEFSLARIGAPRGTNFAFGVRGLCDSLALTASPDVTLIMVSDGIGNVGPSVAGELPCSVPTPVHTVAVGAAASCTDGVSRVGTLQDIADLSGGTCTEVANAADLTGVLEDTVAAQVQSVHYTIDGGPAFDVSADVSPALPFQGGGDLDLSTVLTGLDAGEHRICVTAVAATLGGSGPSGSVTECVDVGGNAAPVADAGADVVVTEGGVALLDAAGSSDPDGDPLSYRWQLIDYDGPVLPIPTSFLAQLPVQTLDDGVYTFQLTVSDGVFQDTDTVDVVVTNGEPAIASAQLSGTTEGGATLLTASFTDPGAVDTHTARIDWGDGSAVELVDVSGQASGTGTLVVPHVFGDAGPASVTLELIDDDDGIDSTTVDALITEALAIWATGTGADALSWTSAGTVVGRVHSNGGLTVSGPAKSVDGSTEYAGTLDVTGPATFDPPPTLVSAEPSPVSFALADYAPGGRAALTAGTQWYDHTAECDSGTWAPGDALATGVHYADCDIVLEGPEVAQPPSTDPSAPVAAIDLRHSSGCEAIVDARYSAAMAGDLVGASWFVDGRFAASGMVAVLELGPGPHQITLQVRDDAGQYSELAAHSVDTGSCTPSPLADCQALDFEGAPAGMDASDLYATEGVLIGATARNGSPGTAITFDSSSPTGGDNDLGTPNQSYGGPGVGSGGASNDIALGMVLVRAENTHDGNGDGLVDTPDDHASGAILTFDFDTPRCVFGADLVDVEDSEKPARFTGYDDGGTELFEVEAGGGGDNSYEFVAMDGCGVSHLDVNLRGSGALDTLLVCEPGAGGARGPIASGPVTIASSGTITVQGPSAALTSYIDGALLVSDNQAGEPDAVRLSAGSGAYSGFVYTGSGRVLVDGASSRFTCGLVGETIALEGAVEAHAADCSRPARTGADPLLAPELALSLVNSTADALPAEPVDALVSATHTGARLVVPEVIGLQNVGSSVLTVDAVTVTVQALDAGTGTWSALPTVTALGTSGIAGSAVNPGELASWGIELQGTLTPAQLTDLLDPGTTQAVRTQVDFQTSGGTARPLYRFGDDHAPALRAQGASIDDLQLTVATVDGRLTALDGTTDAALASLQPGDIANVAVAALAPAPAPIGSSESADAYLARLNGFDHATLGSVVTGRASAGLGPVLAITAIDTSTLHLPVVDLTAQVPSSLVSGEPLVALVDAANTSSADAVGLAADIEVESDGSLTPIDLPTSLSSGGQASAAPSIALPPAATGSTARTTALWSWSDAAGNNYGPVGRAADTQVDLPATVLATLVDTLAVDADGNGLVTPGDTVRYSAVVQNNGSLPLPGSVLTLPLDPNTTYAPGSATTDTGTVTSADDTAVVVDTGGLPGFGAATVSFQAVVTGTPSLLSVQGTVTGTGLGPALTDDPALPGAFDPTTTPITEPLPSLAGVLMDAVLVDADLDDTVSEGDTLRYTATVENRGIGSLTGVHFTLAPDIGTAVVVGSVLTDLGTVDVGNTAGDTTVDIDVATLATGSFAMVQLDLLVTQSRSATRTMVAVQGQLTANETSAVTDDPGTAAPDDATETPLGVTSGGDIIVQYADCDPADIALTAPGEGVRVAGLVDITADVTLAPGTVSTWRLVSVPEGLDPDVSASVITEGTGDIPANLGTFDPTLVRNGVHSLQLEVTDSNGDTCAATQGIYVDGQAKLGSLDIAFTDAEWSSAITNMSMVRSYRTIRRNEPGDFGFGWQLSFGDMTVQTNGPLGDGGWGQESCGGGFIWTELCFVTTKPHIATVRWPDGRVEAFDFTPTATTTFFSTLGTAAFTPRAGAFSRLEPAPGEGALFFDPASLRGGIFGEQGVYDPQRYVLTDIFGTRYTLDKDEGLVETVDFRGNRTTYGRDGIFPDDTPGVVFIRDSQDRIEEMHLPDGEVILYDYDTNGDLVLVTDQRGDTVEFGYDAEHRLQTFTETGEGVLATITYDSEGRLDTRTDAAGVLMETDVDTSAYTTTVTGPDPGLTTVTTYDDDGLMVREEQRFADPDGIAQVYVTTSTYTADYLLDTRTLPTGAVEDWDYDSEGRVTSYTDAAGVVRETEYGPNSQPSNRFEGGEFVERTLFNAQDLPEQVFRGDGTLLRQVGYDTQGRPTSLTSGTGETLTLTYDSRGFIDTMTLPDFSGTPDLVDVDFDGLGRLEAVTADYPDGAGTTFYVYDSNGNREAIIDPRGQSMLFTYDTFGRMESYTDKLGETTSYTYDLDGRELTKTNRNGEVLTRTYDTAGRLETLTGPGVDRAFDYDALGRTVYARESAHITEFSYDEAGVTTVHAYATDSAGHVDASWSVVNDGAGRLVDLVGPNVGGVDAMDTTHTYDHRGRLDGLTESGVGTFTFGYDGASRVDELVRPNGVITTTTYDDAGRTTSTATFDALDALIHEVGTTWDSRGLPDTQTDPEGTLDYEHDERGRLTGVDHPAGSAFDDEAYTYDQANRRTSSHRDPASEVIYDDGDRLLQDAEYSYDYDDEGRRTSRTDRASGEVTTYTWNVLDQLVAVEDEAEGTTWRFVYDAMDRRVLVTTEETSTGAELYGEAFVYDGNDTVRASYNTAGNLNAAYVTGFGFGEVLARIDGVVEYAVRDRLGSTVGWVDGGGAVAEVVLRDAYGVREALPVGVEPFGYTGHAEDGTGLVWGRARYLDVGAGAWLSADSLASQPRYAYAMGGPSFAADPTGTETALDYGLAVLVGTGVGTVVALEFGIPGANYLIQAFYAAIDDALG